MAHLQQQQHETLQLHQQYLTYQTEFARALLQFVQQRMQVLTQAAHVPGGLLERLDQDLAALSGHQTETLRVHEQYLARQNDYAASLLHLLQQQYAAMCGHVRRKPGRRLACRAYIRRAHAGRATASGGCRVHQPTAGCSGPSPTRAGRTCTDRSGPGARGTRADATYTDRGCTDRTDPAADGTRAGRGCADGSGPAAARSCTVCRS
jgi:hypothetical protein